MSYNYGGGYGNGGNLSPAGPGLNKNYKRMTVRTGFSPTRRTFYEEDRYADMQENYGRPITPRRGQRENQRRANGEDYYQGRTDGWDREKYKVPGYNANPRRMTLRTGLSPRNSYAESTASRFSQKGFEGTMSSQGPLKNSRSSSVPRVKEPENAYYTGAPFDEKKVQVQIEEVTTPLPYPIPIAQCQEEEAYQWKNVVYNFVPAWFAVIMGTGIVATSLNRSPFQFPGLSVIARIIFFMDVILFSTFLSLTIARYTIWPHKFKEMLAHPAQSLFVGTFPMAMSTLINGSVFILLPIWTGNKETLITFLIAFWYIDVVVSILTCFYMPFVIMYKHDAKIENVTAGWLLPIVSTVVVAATGGVLAEVMTNDTHAIVILIFSYVLWGTSVPLALMIMTIYLFRLTMYNLPPRIAVPSTFVALGPLFQGSFGIVQLGRVARVLFVRAKFPPSSPGMVGEVFYGMGLMLGMILYGAGLVWMFFAIATVLKGPIPFTIGWWAFTFPLGVAAAATISFGIEFNSLIFQIWSTVLTYAVTGVWAVVFSGTVYRVMTGEFFRL